MSEREIVEYQCITEADRSTLVRRVNFAIEAGYEPLGGVAHAIGQFLKESWSQAVVKYKTN